VRLRGLIAAAPVDARLAGEDTDPELTAVVHDTRDVMPGSLFCCIRGARVDGHDLAAAALDAGAAALVVEHALPVAVPQVVVPDVRRAMGPLAAAFWGEPSHELVVVGVTGTSGKTTVTHLLQAVLREAGLSCGIIGTLSGARTTPESTELQSLLAGERDAGRRAVAMEVSSHGLELHRVDGTRFATTVFTNLPQDHLDFHHTMDAYFAAKAALFTSAFTDRAVVCVDDAWGRRLLDRLRDTSGVDARPYSLDDVGEVRLSRAGASFRWRGEPVELRLAGRFNVTNAVGAAAATESLGIAPDVVARGLSAAPPVPGRFEAVDAGQPFAVLVDYAHKPDALDNVLRTARELTDGRVVLVFGAGGDRDRQKRPLMGKVARDLADHVIVTSDNPRSEDPLAIIQDVLQGAGTDVEIDPDRRSAISRAMELAAPGDVVVIAGKGHEQGQEIAGEKLPFDDRVVAREALQA
jgi:UDP-N-acetylmuramoyl-L-alanyl-D-glutamate--2,6-diaminopimelate ligase